MSSSEHVARLGLLSLPRIGPARASWLLADSSAEEVLAHLRAGRLPPTATAPPAGVTERLIARWIDAARAVDESALLLTCVRRGIELIGPRDPRWPLGADPDPPMLLLAEGCVELLTRRPAVAIVGTRRCSAIGRAVARTFGAELAEAGVPVISGLASGIDGAAHEGVLSVRGGGAVAVVGSGLDVIYPRVNASLWRRVAVDGLLLSEAPLGARPERWRFPARNRLIAALADVVVVVESHAAGGSLLTVGEAADRGVTVMAVPGSVTSPASAGSNQLLTEGAPPACSIADILDQLPGAVRSVDPAPDESASGPSSADVSTLARAVLRDVAAGAVHVDDLVEAHRAPIPELLAAIDELERFGLASLDGSTVIVAAATSSSAPAQPMSGQPATSSHKE